MNCQSLFRKCKEICLLGGKQELRRIVFDHYCKEYLEAVAKTLSRSLSYSTASSSDRMSVDGDMDGKLPALVSSLQSLLNEWEAFKDILTTLSHILLFLDKTYLLTKSILLSPDLINTYS